MLILQQTDDPGPFRSRWQPTWAEVMQRNASETCPERSRVLRRLALADSDEDSEEDLELEDEEEEEEDQVEETPSPAVRPPTLYQFGRSASANWHRPRVPCPLRSHTTGCLASTPQDNSSALLLAADQLKSEASRALAQAEPLARMQVQVERQASPCHSVLDGVSVQRSPFSVLHDLDKAQLRVLVSTLLDQISVTSKDLVQLLMERDELHMAQDAMLIDVEDQTRRAHELALLLQRDSEANKPPPPTASDRPHSSSFFTRVLSWARPRPNSTVS